MFNLILFGPPGSGKGTQSVKISEKYNLAHISTGEIFRRNIQNETPLGLRVKSIIERGELVPDELLEEILETAMGRVSDKAGFVFDGFPRTIQQALDLDDMLKKRNEKVDIVLALKVDDREIVRRLMKRAEMEGRKDDTREVIENRLRVYNDQTQPLIEFYGKNGSFISVNGIGMIDEVFDSICKKVDPLI